MFGTRADFVIFVTELRYLLRYDRNNLSNQNLNE